MGDWYRIVGWRALYQQEGLRRGAVTLDQSIVDGYEWQQLTDIERGQWFGVLMVAAKYNGLVPADVEFVRKEAKLAGALDFGVFIRLGLIATGPATPAEEDLKPKLLPAAAPQGDLLGALVPIEVPPVERMALARRPRTEILPAPKEIEADFREWYALYPKKKAPLDAMKAYEKARKMATREELLTGLELYIRHQDPEINWKYPATWLNKGCWLEEHTPSVQSRRPYSERDATLAALDQMAGGRR